MLVSSSITNGTGRFSQVEISDFRSAYRTFMLKTKKLATRNLDRFISRRARSRFLCWDVLKRLRSPAGTVDIDHAVLVNHFKGIFFTSNEPIRFTNPWSKFAPDIGGSLTLLFLFLFSLRLCSFFSITRLPHPLLIIVLILIPTR